MKHSASSIGAAALAAGVAAGTAHGEMVVGYENEFCMSSSTEIPFWDSVRDACSAWGIKSYKLESENFESCHVCDDDDGSVPPPGTVIIIPPLPPCPEGQHRDGAGCHADHVCGDDEIGGGSEECEPCGAGEVPIEDGTACEECEHGEYESGECASQCSNSQLDSAASWSLRGIPREPWEQLESYTCDSNGNMHIKLLGTSQNDRNVCEVRAGGPPASSAYGHSHPHFEWPRDRGVFCHNSYIQRKREVKDWNCKHGYKFGGADKSGAKTRKKPMYLIEPWREQVRVYRDTGKTGFFGGPIWDEFTVWESADFEDNQKERCK